MNHPELLIPSKLLEEFKNCTRLQFSGRLNAKTAKGDSWIFYYRLGRIVWATAAEHTFRRWRRYLTLYCPQLDLEKIQIRQADVAATHWDYQLLNTLHESEQVRRDQINTIVENTIAELLFDLAQHASFSTLSCDRDQEVILDAPMSFTSADLSLRMMQELWSGWCDAGLANFSPNLAPVLRRPEQLQQQVSPTVYKNFVNLINGKYTLRELSLRLKQDLLPLSRSLLPYVLKGIIELVEVQDMPLPMTPGKAKGSGTPQSRAPKAPLIACVDDSPQTAQILEQIFTSNGLRFVGIQDSVQALPLLIESKPDLIFLDLIMPVANGYEICSQLRRSSLFTNTPVIILTGSDGLVDRVRAKVVGATDFMSKPIVAEKVLGMVRKYIKAQQPAREVSNAAVSN